MHSWLVYLQKDFISAQPHIYICKNKSLVSRFHAKYFCIYIPTIYILSYQSYPSVNMSIHTYRICIYSRTKANPQLNTLVHIYETYILWYQNYLSPSTARSHLAVMPLTNLPGRIGILIHTLPFKRMASI